MPVGFRFHVPSPPHTCPLSLHDALPISSLPQVDAAALEAKLAAAARSWDEDLAAEAGRQLGDRPARAMLGICSGAIPDTYKADRSEEHTSELQSLAYLVCRLLLEKKKPI